MHGYKAGKEYALLCLRTAIEAGASSLILCDTNGGALPEEVTEAVEAAKQVENRGLYFDLVELYNYI